MLEIFGNHLEIEELLRKIIEKSRKRIRKHNLQITRQIVTLSTDNSNYIKFPNLKQCSQSSSRKHEVTHIDFLDLSHF